MTQRENDDVQQQQQQQQSETQNSEPQKKQDRPRKNNRKKPNKKQDTARRMLVDASKHEETRVAVAQQGKLEDFEVESLVRRQIKGNIYLAKVTRVEPSLQAAFVNYGGNRHGFLPFSEIHPDYYRIPVADRERLMAEQEELERVAAEEAARIEEEEDRKAAEEEQEEATKGKKTNAADKDADSIEEVDNDETIVDAGADADTSKDSDEDSDDNDDETSSQASENADDNDDSDDDNDADNEGDNEGEKDQKSRGRGRGRYRNRRGRGGKRYAESRNKQDRVSDDDDEVSSVEPFWKRMRRAYKIQEVIKRGQIMLIQVGKEERGNKGAAVTTYITLPGRYCVLMPNTPQSGGVSRKISNYKDRKRMRDILKDLSVPQGMSVILRTAGTMRTKAEIKRDMDYLMRLWNNARDLTLKSTAPALINEEGSLIKRAIRDIYNKDIDEVIVSGDNGYKTARDMMKMLMPSHAKKVTQYKEDVPLFIKHNIEEQIEDMHSPQVELKSGGYLVINPTEALISIDVNSGRSTKERNIEDTALRTNIEAAQEIARQLRLRDLGGLVVVDFIDMENRRYNGKVEKAMRDALAGDRARIQIGRISSFGLMEMSRQRLHPSLTETHFEPCPHCHGMGIVKTTDTMALTILRAIEQSGLKQSPADVTVTMSPDVAMYLFNHHRRALTDLEDRYGLSLQTKTGHIDNERGYELVSKAKQVKKEPAEETVDNQGDNDGETENKDRPTTGKQSESSERAEKRRSSNSRRSKKNNPGNEGDTTRASDTTAETPDTSVKSEETETPSKEAVQEEKPKKRRGRPAKKKVVIEEVTQDTSTQKNDESNAPTNDNQGDIKDVAVTSEAPTTDNTRPQTEDDNSQENIAAREAETVNEAPKKKKRGWWNKITS